MTAKGSTFDATPLVSGSRYAIASCLADADQHARERRAAHGFEPASSATGSALKPMVATSSDRMRPDRRTIAPTVATTVPRIHAMAMAARTGNAERERGVVILGDSREPQAAARPREEEMQCQPSAGW